MLNLFCYNVFKLFDKCGSLAQIHLCIYFGYIKHLQCVGEKKSECHNIKLVYYEFDYC